MTMTIHSQFDPTTATANATQRLAELQTPSSNDAIGAVIGVEGTGQEVIIITKNDNKELELELDVENQDEAEDNGDNATKYVAAIGGFNSKRKGLVTKGLVAVAIGAVVVAVAGVGVGHSISQVSKLEAVKPMNEAEADFVAGRSSSSKSGKTCKASKSERAAISEGFCDLLTFFACKVVKLVSIFGGFCPCCSATYCTTNCGSFSPEDFNTVIKDCVPKDLNSRFLEDVVGTQSGEAFVSIDIDTDLPDVLATLGLNDIDPGGVEKIKEFLKAIDLTNVNEAEVIKNMTALLESVSSSSSLGDGEEVANMVEEAEIVGGGCSNKCAPGVGKCGLACACLL